MIRFADQRKVRTPLGEEAGVEVGVNVAAAYDDTDALAEKTIGILQNRTEREGTGRLAL